MLSVFALWMKASLFQPHILLIFRKLKYRLTHLFLPLSESGVTRLPQVIRKNNIPLVHFQMEFFSF